jgi:hypothetical protein
VISISEVNRTTIVGARPSWRGGRWPNPPFAGPDHPSRGCCDAGLRQQSVPCRVPLGRKDAMLQWKPRIYAVLTLGTLAVAAFLGGLADFGQFGW